MIELYKKISLINDALRPLIELKELLEKDISIIENTPSMDRITIDKINAQIIGINLKIEALESEKLLTQGL